MYSIIYAIILLRYSFFHKSLYAVSKGGNDNNMINITKTTKTILFASLITAMILPFSGMNFAEAEKAPDMTDYESMYKEMDKKIRDNKKSIDADEKKLKDKSFSNNEIKSIEKQLQDKKDKHEKFFDELAEIQLLNIESYKLDSETQKIFDDAKQALTDKYMNENGVYDLFTENKYRKIVLFIDPIALEDQTQQEVDSLVSEIKNSVDVDVDVHISTPIDTHSTSCPSSTSACHPGKGGIQIAHAGSGGGSTLGFKAYHPTHGYGFIIAGHEAVSVGTQIVQPDNGGTYGYVDVMGSGTCDCAFVDFSGHSMYDQIWAPDVGTVYPVGVRNTAATPSGTFVMYDGIGSTTQLGTVIVEGSKYGYVSMAPSGGDSGSAIFQPQVDGTAKLYGMLTKQISTYGLYEPYDWIKADLGLTW